MALEQKKKQRQKWNL